jgi:hypothetical protein
VSIGAGLSPDPACALPLGITVVAPSTLEALAAADEDVLEFVRSFAGIWSDCAAGFSLVGAALKLHG